MTVRKQLWDVAVHRNGFFSLSDARDLGLNETAVQVMAHRNRLTHAARGVFRFPEMPASKADPYQLAVLWTGAPEAALSHETALEVRGLSDINPGYIDVTVAAHRRIRRAGGEKYRLHYEDLRPGDLDWWEGVPTVSVATAIRQCMAAGTPTYLLRQAIEEGARAGYLRAAEADDLARHLVEGSDARR